MNKKRSAGSGGSRKNMPLEVLVKFRTIVNGAKQHFRWVEQQCGINGAQLWALWEISRAPTMRVSDLSAALAMHQSSTSNLVEKLVSAGLAMRSRSAEDQRVVHLALTRKGQALLKRAPKPARGILPEALHRLPPDKLSGLNRALEALLKCMHNSGGRRKAAPLGVLLGDR